MMSWKALGIVLFLYSTKFGESRRLGKYSSSAKKATTAQQITNVMYKNEAMINGEELRQMIANISYDPKLQNVTGNISKSYTCM